MSQNRGMNSFQKSFTILKSCNSNTSKRLRKKAPNHEYSSSIHMRYISIVYLPYIPPLPSAVSTHAYIGAICTKINTLNLPRPVSHCMFTCTASTTSLSYQTQSYIVYHRSCDNTYTQTNIIQAFSFQ